MSNITYQTGLLEDKLKREERKVKALEELLKRLGVTVTYEGDGDKVSYILESGVKENVS